MSQETREAMEQAIRNHFSDTTAGSFMTDYYLIATGPASSGERAHAYVYEDGESPYHITKGLIAMSVDYINEVGGNEHEH